ncbi:hypothetical protein S40288_10297, partial [Stachybotrys chartarum IBT 40288]
MALDDVYIRTKTSLLHRLESVQTVLNLLWPHAFSQSHPKQKLHLFFGGYAYHNVIEAQIMWNDPTTVQYADSFHPSPASPKKASNSLENLPMVCYLSKDQLASNRKKIVRVVHDRAGHREPGATTYRALETDSLLFLSLQQHFGVLRLSSSGKESGARIDDTYDAINLVNYVLQGLFASHVLPFIPMVLRIIAVAVTSTLATVFFFGDGCIGLDDEVLSQTL